MMHSKEDMDPTPSMNNGNSNGSNVADMDTSMEVFIGSGQQHAKRRFRAATDSGTGNGKSTPRRGRLRNDVRSTYHSQRKRVTDSTSSWHLSKYSPVLCFICLISTFVLLWFLMVRTIFYFPSDHGLNGNGDSLLPHPGSMNEENSSSRIKSTDSAEHQWRQRLMVETGETVSTRTQRRRTRTLPNQIEEDESIYFQENDFAFPDQDHGWIRFPAEDNLDEQVLSTNPCGTHAQAAKSSNFQKRDELNADSHVLITGVLNPIGFHLVMALRERCGVQNIYGVDPMFPNTVIHRLHYLQPKLSLLTADKWLWLPLPFVGLDPKHNPNHKHDAKKKTFNHEKTTREVHWMRSYPQLTHIVHLATSQPAEDHYHYNHGNNPLGGTDTSSMFSIRQSMTSMEQLLHSMVDFKPNERDTAATPHLVYASTTPMGNKGKHIFAATKLMDEVLAKTYHNLNKIYSVALRFSSVYGPWGNPGTAYYDLAEMAVRHWHDEGTINAQRDFEDYSMLFNLAADTSKKKKLVLEEHDFLFVDDAVNAIIVAMQYRTKDSIPAKFDIVSGETVKMKHIADIIESMMPIQTSAETTDFNQIGESNDFDIDSASQSLSWSSETSLKDGIRKLLSWHLDRHLPYGQSPYNHNEYKETMIAAQETGHAFTKRLGQPPCEANDYTCLRYKPVFPCASECAENNVCIPSIFDSIKDLSLELSEDCDIVLYTTSLGRDIDDIILKSDLQPPEDTEGDTTVPVICNIAFIPKESSLVKLAVQSIADESMQDIGIKSELTYEQKVEALNGRLLHKGWMLIWIPNSMEPLSLDEMTLFKLSPSKMFHPTVKYAMFMDEFFSVSAHLDDVQFMIGEMNRKALPERIRKLKGDKTKYVLPSEPERKCAILFSNLKYQKSNDKDEISPAPGSKISTLDAMKYMLYEVGYDTTKKTPAKVKKQREFYEKIPSYVNKQDLRSIFEPKYDYKLKHWIRSRWVIHDLSLEEARQLRCEWYQETLHWENELDQLSFAHVMAHREVERRIARREPDDHEKQHSGDDIMNKLTDKTEWHLLLNDNEEYESEELLQSVPDNEVDHEEDDEVEEDSVGEGSGSNDMEVEDEKVGIYARIMSEAVMFLSRQEWIAQHENKIKKKKRKNRRGQEMKKVNNINHEND